MQKLVIAINSLSSQVFGIVTVLIGCAMLLLSHHYQITDSSIAAGIVGAGINMLTHDIIKTSTRTDGSGQSTTTQTVTAPGTAETAQTLLEGEKHGTGI